MDREGIATARENYILFLDTEPPGRFSAAAMFALGTIELRKGSDEAAIQWFQKTSEQFPQEFAESGLPFGPLAGLHLLKMLPASEELLEAACSNAVFRPSFLTPRLLNLAQEIEDRLPDSPDVVGQYRGIWLDFEFTRQLVEAARHHFRFEIPNHAAASETKNPQIVSKKAPSVSGGANLLVVPNVFTVSLGKVYFCLRLNPQNATSHRILGIPTGSSLLLGDELPRLKRLLGSFFGVTLEFGGVTAFHDGFSHEDTPISARIVETEGALESLTIAVHLARPDLFFAGQSKRTRTFGSLIAVAVAGAMLGWLSSWRAFRRQQRLNETKTNLVSSVSHEFRAPIASMRLMAEGLESGRIQEDQKKREYFKFIVQECRRLGSLVENLLDFARIEQDRKKYEFEACDVVGLVQHSVGLMRPYAKQNGIELEMIIEEQKFATLESQPILDGRSIQQALINLIDNGMKHSKKGSNLTVGLVLKLDRSSSGDAIPPLQTSSGRSLGVQIWIEDQGEGIPLKEQSRVFDRFYRVGSELTRTTQGVGIGLSIVKHIVEAHGGAVTLRSTVGKGSRFTMELPFERVTD